MAMKMPMIYVCIDFDGKVRLQRDSFKVVLPASSFANCKTKRVKNRVDSVE